MTQAFDALTDTDQALGREGTQSLRVAVVNSVEAVLALRPELQALCDDLGEDNVFYEPWMMAPALTHLDAGHDLHVLCFYETGAEGRLCGFVPLLRMPLHPLLPIYAYQSWHHPHCFRCTPLMRRGFALSCWNALFDWLYRQPPWRRFLCLRRLPADGEVEEALREALSKRPALRYTERSQAAAYLHITETSGDEVLRRAMSGSTLSKLRRQQRRLAESGELSFHEIDQDTDLEALLDEFLALEAAGWKGRQGTALACNAQEEAFFRSAIAEAHKRGQLSFLSLRLDGKLLAGQSSLISRNGSFLFKTAYDERYAKYSPGILLEIEHLRRMHDSTDPLRGKLAWADSCADPENGPVYRCWPERRTVRYYRIAGGFGLPTLIVRLWPLLRALHQFLQRTKARLQSAPQARRRPVAKA